MTKTIILHDVKAADLEQVLAVMKADGYTTSSQQEPDGDYTVIGTKNVPDSIAGNQPPSAAAPTQPTSPSGTAKAKPSTKGS